MIEYSPLFFLVVVPLIGVFSSAVLTPVLNRWVCFVLSVFGFLLSTFVWTTFDSTQPNLMQMEYLVPWIPMYSVHFALGIDGLSLLFVWLTKVMVPIAILSAWKEERHPNGMMAALLFLDATMTATFLATDIVLFYVAWELMLVPMLLLIGIWGSANRIYASLKFFLFTFVGSVFMLAAIFWVASVYYEQFGFYSFQIASFYQITFPGNALFLGFNPQELVFLAFLIAFAIKVPVFPLHTWLPDAHVQAPTAGSVLLAAVLLKMGIYGLLRFCIPICPEAFATFTPLLVTLGLAGIFYGALVAFSQTDAKKLVAYSSVSHMGFLIIGICAVNSEALTGVLLQMVNHGISTGALFLLVGMLYERTHSKKFEDFGGLAAVLPWFAVVLVLVSASSMAVPGLNGFVGEFLILLGTFKTNFWWGGIACLAVIFSAVYMLIFVKKILFGPITVEKNKDLKDLSFREWACLLPLILLIFWFGVYPGFFTRPIEGMLNTYWSRALKIGLPTVVTEAEVSVEGVE